MQLSKADYYEFLAHLHRVQVAKLEAERVIARAERGYLACVARLRAQYPEWPEEPPRGWRWSDATCDVSPEGSDVG